MKLLDIKNILTATRYETYAINTDKSGPKGLYLEKESKFNVIPW